MAFVFLNRYLDISEVSWALFYNNNNFFVLCHLFSTFLLSYLVVNAVLKLCQHSSSLYPLFFLLFPLYLLPYDFVLILFSVSSESDSVGNHCRQALSPCLDTPVLCIFVYLTVWGFFLSIIAYCLC